ncbi:medium-chain fatty acid ethyl ester synthase/esterase 1 [Podospora fimiseda]|uniref:alcohol O-acetyltransferase n=1 Tax=Podospora fimiseda TaxID=252190 RepID=A0AAN7BRM5_9PEZI|nr:medium-chain fatty acid ethyl ester synthase/esterase 1 [Podospora fimiseda]
MEWLGRATIDFAHSPTTLSLKKKDGSTTDLFRVVEAAVPPCHLNPVLFNGHVQTMWTAVKEHGPQIYYRRRVFEADKSSVAGSFAVDFVTEPHDDEDPSLPPRTAYFSEEKFSDLGSDDRRPMLIALHGLSGGSHEIYLRHGIASFLNDGNNWEVCVLNARGCAKSKITSGVLFNARATWDLRHFVKWARKTFPNRPLFAVGFSLGGNILTNYVGEEGSNCELKAAISVGNPFDLDISNKALQRTALGKHVYSKTMGTSLKRLIANHKEDLIKTSTKLDFDRIESVTYIHEFDRAVQTVLWGYPTETAYYRDASSCDAVLAIRIPFLAISALDDPIAVAEAIPFEEFKQNPHTVLCTTSLGGHLSWFEAGGGRWFAKPMHNFLSSLVSEIDLDATTPDLNANLNGIESVTEFAATRRKLQIL